MYIRADDYERSTRFKRTEDCATLSTGRRLAYSTDTNAFSNCGMAVNEQCLFDCASSHTCRFTMQLRRVETIEAPLREAPVAGDWLEITLPTLWRTLNMGFDSSSTVTLRRCSRVYAIQSGCILVTPSSLCSIQPVSMTQSVLTISPINMGGQCDTDSKVYIFVATGERAVIDFNSRSAAAVYPLTRVLTSIGYLNLVASPSPPFTPPLPSYPFGHPMSPPPHPIAPPLIPLPIAPPSTPTNHVVPPGSPYVRSDSTNCTVDSFEPRCICAVNMKKETYGGQTFFTLSLHWFIAEINIQFSRSDVDVWAHSPTHDNEQYAQVASSGEFLWDWEALIKKRGHPIGRLYRLRHRMSPRMRKRSP